MRTFPYVLRNLAQSLLGLAILAGSASAKEAEWLTDFPAAQTKAKAEKKLILADFTGSDWCIWCKRLKGEVFDKVPFADEVAKKFILVELDFPREKKLAPELKEQNNKLAKKYKIRGYPTILILNPEGEVMAHTGYRPGGPEKYTQQLADLVQTYESLAGLREKLAKAAGLDRAKLLDQMIDAYDKLGNETDDLPAWHKEIIALDSDNKAGLKSKYQFIDMMAEVRRLAQARKLDEAQAAVDKILQLPGLTGVQKQDALLATADYSFTYRGPAAAVATLQKALDAAPESPKAASIKAAVQRLELSAKAETAALVLKAKAEKASGEERMKLLDQLIEAYAKVRNRLAGKDQSADVQKWCKEILALDPEDKSGLKRKYEFRVTLDDARTAFLSKKFAEAEKVVDKALALKDLTADEHQRAALLKSNCCVARKDYQASIDCLQKAMDAAPNGPNVAYLKALIQRSEKLLEAQKASNSGGKNGQAASNNDTLTVPDGKPEELFAFIEGLQRGPAEPPKDYQARLDQNRKTTAAILEAADKILAAKPTEAQKAKALRIQLTTIGSQPSVLINAKSVARLEQLIGQLEAAGLSKDAREARRTVLSCKVRIVSFGSKPEDLDKVVQQVKDFFASGPADESWVYLANTTGRAAEHTGNAAYAAKTYRELSKILALKNDDILADAVLTLEGAARRLELAEHPMLVDGITLDGKPLDWSKYSGKVVLVDFWATWCGSCRAELPNVKKAYEAYHGRGFEVVGISLDQSREALDKFMETEKLPWTIIMDDSWNRKKGSAASADTTGGDARPAARALARYYGVFGIPTAILLGKDGKAVSLNALGPALEQELAKLLGPAGEKKE